MHRSLSVAVGFLCGLALCTPVVADEAKQQAAVRAAESWLKFLDAGDYTKARDRAAASFKRSYDDETWESMLDASRTPLEAVRERAFTSAQYITKLPGGVTGEFVVVNYATRFVHHKVIEVVTVELESDGAWKVSGYYIKEP